MPILCIHNPVIHKDPQACYKVEVKFQTLFTNVQQSRHQVMNVLTPEQRKTLLLQTEGWTHYRPSRVGPVLRLPAAKGNRKVTVMVWLEQESDNLALLQDHNRLVRELDVLLNGQEGAAQQASLCDIVAQLRAAKRAGQTMLLSTPRNQEDWAKQRKQSKNQAKFSHWPSLPELGAYSNSNYKGALTIPSTPR